MDITKKFGYCTAEIDENDYTLHKRVGDYAWCFSEIELTPSGYNVTLWGNYRSEFSLICPACLESCTEKQINKIKMYFIIKKLKGN